MKNSNNQSRKADAKIPAKDARQNPQTDNPQQAGYSPEPEKQETKKEQERMHNERNPNELNADRQAPPPNEGAGKTEGNKR